MQLTNELRIVERYVQTPNEPVRLFRTWQQKWAVFNQNIIVEYEWRDVPIVKEPRLCDVPCGKADYRGLLKQALKHFYQDGVPVDPKHPKWITVKKIEKALE